jgi:preprotein translocase subunit Sec61beta
MSVTHPETVARSLAHYDVVERHPQLTPFLVAVVIVAVSITVALAITGLPA